MTLIGKPTRCVDCEEIRLAEACDARPSQVLPLPRSALAGYPRGRSSFDLTRRRLLEFGVAGFASVYGPKLLGWESVWEATVAEADPVPNALVVLYLAGGQDGLNVIVPNGSTDYAQYVGKRPTIHRGQGATTAGTGGRVGSQTVPGSGGNLAFANPLLSTAAGGDNGSATGFDSIYGDGSGGAGSNLLLLPAADYTPPNLSHFTSSDYWFSGDVNILSTGWLGRYLDAYGSATNPLQGISIGTSLSKALRTESAPVCAISSLNSLGFRMSGTPSGDSSIVNANIVLAELAAAAAGAGNDHLAHTRQSYELATDVYTDTKALGTPTLGSGYPAKSSLAPQLELAAFLLGANLGTRVITINWGSFDTHGNQVAQQDPQLSELSRCLPAFLADLQNRGIANRVSVLMFSEFGRRVSENGSAGTDHGAGGLMMMAGAPVKGGVIAQLPEIGTLDANGDVQVQTDFRSVYQSVISDWLGGDPARVLPNGGSFPGITRYDGTSGMFK